MSIRQLYHTLSAVSSDRKTGKVYLWFLAKKHIYLFNKFFIKITASSYFLINIYSPLKRQSCKYLI